MRTATVALLLLCSATAIEAREAGEAARAFARGTALYDKGDYPAAIVAFERAHQLRPHHAVLCSIALCYEQLNRFVQAAEQYRRCLHDGAARTARAASVRQALTAAEARITYVEVRSPGQGGSLFVDGVAAGTTPRRVPLDPGHHVLEVRRPGATPASITLRVLSGEERSVTLIPRSEPAPLTAAVPAPAASPATTRPPTAPSTTPPPAASRRRVTPAWFWTTVGLTIALGGAAAIMGGLTYQTASDYDTRPTREGYDTFVERRLATNLLTGLAIAAAGTGTVLFFYTDFSGRRHQQEVVAGWGLRGAF